MKTQFQHFVYKLWLAVSKGQSPELHKNDTFHNSTFLKVMANTVTLKINNLQTASASTKLCTTFGFILIQGAICSRTETIQTIFHHHPTRSDEIQYVLLILSRPFREASRCLRPCHVNAKV
jgi:hypothetical protein